MPKALYRDLKALDIVFAKEKLGKVVTQKQGLVFANSDEDGLHRSDFQYTQHLLCGTCEQRFSVKEDFARTLWKKPNGFGAKERLERLLEKDYRRLDGGAKAYITGVFSENEKAMLLYFMASIVWRADCKGWPRGIDRGLSTLGPKRREQFRQFLLGETELTEYGLLAVIDTSDNTPVSMALPTVGMRLFGCPSHTIMVPGIRLFLLIGNIVPDFRPLKTDRLNVAVFGDDLTRSKMHQSYAKMMATSRRRYKED